MKKLVLKYVAVVTATLFAFVNFIACGAQMYKVSLRGDHDETRVPPEARIPSAKYFGIHAAGGWVELPVRFALSRELSADQSEGLRRAMATWEKAVGHKLFEFQGVDEKTGDSFKDLYSSLNDNVNGHYLDGDWQKTGKSSLVLATTIWDNDPNNIDAIRTADIRFNKAYYIIGDSFILQTPENDRREIVDMETLALHELGHMLGLTHVDPEVDPHSIMNPSIFIGEGLANRRLSENDIKRIQQIYPCQGEACDIAALVAAMTTLPSGEDPDIQTSSSTGSASKRKASATSTSPAKTGPVISN